MKYFAASLEKIAQLEAPKPVSPAQLYAAKKAENELKSLMDSGSTSAYATSIASGMLGGLMLPVTLTLPRALDSATGDNLSRYKNSVYVSEFLRSPLFNLNKAEADRIGVMLTMPDSARITRLNQKNIDVARLKLREIAARGEIPGLGKEQLDALLSPFITNAQGKPVEPGEMSSFHEKVFLGTSNPQTRAVLVSPEFNALPLDKKIEEFGRLGQSVFGHPDLKGISANTFNAGELDALINLGRSHYIQRTGKEISDLGAVVKLVSKAMAPAVKGGALAGVVLSGIGAVRQRAKAKEKEKFLSRFKSPSPRVFGGVE